MSWKAKPDESTEETIVEYAGDDKGRIDGLPESKVNGYLTEPYITPIIINAIQEAKNEERVKMQIDLAIYGVDVEWPNKS